MTPITPRPSSEGTRPRSAATDIHSCGYFCDRPECIKAQRDELRERVAELEQDAKRYRALKTRHGYSMVTRLIWCDGFSSSTKDALIDAYADKAAAEIEDHDSAIRE